MTNFLSIKANETKPLQERRQIGKAIKGSKKLKRKTPYLELSNAQLMVRGEYAPRRKIDM